MQEVVGTKIRVDSSTLKQHTQLRAAYHTERANEGVQRYNEGKKVFGNSPQERVEKLSKAGSTLSNYDRPEDPLKGVKNDAVAHEKRAAFFTMFAKYIVPDSHYTLGIDEAENLELSVTHRRKLDLD